MDHMTYDSFSSACERERRGMKRVKFLMLPMLFALAVWAVNGFGITLSETVRAVIVFVYLFWVSALLYSMRQERGASLFFELDAHLRAGSCYYQTPRLPDCLSLSNGGYVKTINQKDEYHSSTFYPVAVSSCGTIMSVDGEIRVYYVSIGDIKEYRQSGYAENVHSCCLRFEEEVGEIAAVYNRFGDCLWERGSKTEASWLRRFLVKSQIFAYNIVLIAGVLYPAANLLGPDMTLTQFFQAEDEETAEDNDDILLYDDEVFVCPGSSSKRYHLDEDCKGLRNCSLEVVVLTEGEAIESGKTQCRLCARRRE